MNTLLKNVAMAMIENITAVVTAVSFMLSSNELTLLLKKMSSNGSTILMASHDIFRVRETCHKIGILKNGKLVKEMLSSEVSSSELESIYLNYMNS